MILLVRHAAPVPASEWLGPDEDRPLSPRGLRSAEGLVLHLSAQPITRILSSPRRRCRDTVAPLAAARGLGIDLVRDLDEDAPSGGARSLLEARVPGLVLCSHRNQITDLLTGLADAGVIVRGARTAPWASVWEMAVEGGRVLSARCLPAAD